MRSSQPRLFDRDVALSLSLLLALVALAVVVVGADGRAAARSTPKRSRRRRAPVQNELGAWRLPALAFVGGVVIAIALVVPVLVLVHWTLRGRARATRELDAGDLVDPAVTTASLGIAAAAVAVAAVLPVAFLTVRYRSPRRRSVANAVIVSGFALPGLVLALALVFFVVQSPLSDLLYQTFTLLVFAYVVHFGSQALRASQVAVGGVPRRVDDAARSLGAGRCATLRARCTLPLMRPGLLAGGGLVLLSTMKELPATLLLAPPGIETLATEIWSTTAKGFFAKAGLAVARVARAVGRAHLAGDDPSRASGRVMNTDTAARRVRGRGVGSAGHRRTRVARRAHHRGRAAVPDDARSASARTTTSTSATSAPKAATASSTAPLPLQEKVRADGSSVSPHDPLLPASWRYRCSLGGWIAAKLALAAAGRRPRRRARLGRGGAPRDPRAHGGGHRAGVRVRGAARDLRHAGVPRDPRRARGHARDRRAHRAPRTQAGRRARVVAVVALPWLSVKYVPVAAALGAPPRPLGAP